MSRSLILIAPHITPALAQAMADRNSHWPQLARLAGRGSIAQVGGELAGRLRPWQVALLDALRLRYCVDQYPSAAVTRTGDIDERARGFWIHALPMHFSAGLNRLTAMMLLGDNRIANAERAELEPTIAAHLRASGFELSRTAGDDWLVHSEHPLEVRTANPDAAVSQPLDEAMPQGRDAAQLRRLMTELQMLLHEHAVNAQRTRRGVLEINAIWFYGEGSLASAQRVALPDSFGDELYLRGIYRMNEQSAAPAPVDARMLFSRMTADAVAVIGTADLDTLEALWMAPLARALALGIVTRLDLVLDCWRLTIHRSSLLKIWRRERPPAQWVAC